MYSKSGFTTLKDKYHILYDNLIKKLCNDSLYYTDKYDKILENINKL